MDDLARYKKIVRLFLHGVKNGAFTGEAVFARLENAEYNEICEMLANPAKPSQVGDEHE